MQRELAPADRRARPAALRAATLNPHVANAVAKPTPRGWRLVKSTENAHVDAVIALAMSAEMAEKRPAPVRVLGWL